MQYACLFHPHLRKGASDKTYKQRCKHASAAHSAFTFRDFAPVFVLRNARTLRCCAAIAEASMFAQMIAHHAECTELGPVEMLYHILDNRAQGKVSRYIACVTNLPKQECTLP